MRIELDEDEVWELVTLVVGQALEDAPLADNDRATVRRWKSESMRTGSEPLRALTRKINEDLAEHQRRKRHSQVRKPDWR
jgi:hypothetical protein